MRQLGYLLVGSALIWVLLAVPAWFLAGEVGLVDTALACGLCLVPMAATMLWCHWSFGASPEQQLLAVLGGTSVRLVAVVAGGVGLHQAFDALNRPAFLVWGVGVYLATSTLEIGLVAR